jgi:pilus assembly protein Flp/PilA
MSSPVEETLMLTIVKKFVAEDSGATLVEYGLLLALIAVVCITVLTTLGGNLKTLFTNVSSDV